MVHTSPGDKIDDSAHVIVARYLQKNGLFSTLAEFERELGLSPKFFPQYLKECKSTVDLEALIQDTTASSGGIQDGPGTSTTATEEQKPKTWSADHPKEPRNLFDGDSTSLPPAVVVAVTVERLLIGSTVIPCIIAATSDKKIRIYSGEDFKLVKLLENVHGSAVRGLHVIEEKYLLSGGIDGKLILTDVNLPDSERKICEVTAHKRMLCGMKVCGDFIASIGYDSTVNLFQFKQHQIVQIGFKKLASIPTALEIVYLEHTKQIFILVVRQDSTVLSYLRYSEPQVIEEQNKEPCELSEVYQVSLNAARYSTHHFTPMDISIPPSHSRLSQDNISTAVIAVATSHVPYMRLLTVELPDLTTESQPHTFESDNQVKYSVPSGAVQGLIRSNHLTMSPQDKYSLAKICWRSDGSGVWVAGDDGVIRGLDVETGAIETELSSHTDRIRALASGVINGREVLVSGSVDKKLLVWV